MAHVHIAPVESYYDYGGIKRFVHEAFDWRADVAALLDNGDTDRLVVVKPNWIQQAHEFVPDVWEPLITHPALVLAVVDCLAERMEGRGAVALCDAPHTYAVFDAILARGNLRARLDEVAARWKDLRIEVVDLRREVWITREQVSVERRPNPPDPRGYVEVNLGRNSLFHGYRGEGRYYGADYDQRVVNAHHCGDTQQYLLAGTPMHADLFINLPKLKTHKKTGITCCLKNLVGINGDKNWLPHFVEGSPETGGDEFPEESAANTLERALKRAGRRAALSIPGLGPWLFRKMRNAGMRVLGDSDQTVRNGNWSGNDTCWRMALDLNRALLYADRDGAWGDTPRPYLAIVDGITGGERNGPLCPDPVHSEVLFGGGDPASVDAAACRLMGFDPAAVPLVAGAFAPHEWPVAPCALDEVRVHDARTGTETGLAALTETVAGGFEPHFGWRELNPARKE